MKANLRDGILFIIAESKKEDKQLSKWLLANYSYDTLKCIKIVESNNGGEYLKTHEEFMKRMNLFMDSIKDIK